MALRFFVGVINLKVYMVFIFLLISGCSTYPKAVKMTDQKTSNEIGKIFVVSHGWHTGIVYPRELLLNVMPELEKRFPEGRYLEIGWGDKGFYEANKITASITLRAVFWPTESVVHVVSVPESPYLSFPGSEIREICLSDNKMTNLGVFLSNSFKRNKADEIDPTKLGIYGDSQFYTGEGRYYLFNTCNKWTAKGLESAGLEISSIFKLTASSVIDFIDANENIKKHCAWAN